MTSITNKISTQQVSWTKSGSRGEEPFKVQVSIKEKTTCNKFYEQKTVGNKFLEKKSFQVDKINVQVSWKERSTGRKFHE